MHVLASTGIMENIAYAGLIHYETKVTENFVKFTAAMKLNTLIEVSIM